MYIIKVIYIYIFFIIYIIKVIMNKCPNFGDIRFSSLNILSFSGHRAHCLKNKRNVILNNSEFNIKYR